MSIEVLLIPLALAALASGVRLMQVSTEKTNESQDVRRTIQFRTNAKDVGLLEQTLTDLGAVVTRQGSSLIAKIRDCEVTFVPDADGVFVAETDATFSSESLSTDINRLNLEYGHTVQVDVYHKVLERAAKNGLQFESEEQDPDGAIILIFVSQEAS